MDLLETVIRGGRVTQQQVASVIGDVAAWAIGGGLAAGYYPNMGGPARPQDHPWAHPPPPPPGPDLETQEARSRARQVLGFARGQVLGREEIEDRRRLLARKTHPDLFPDPARKRKAEERMTSINEAVNILIEELGTPS